MQFGLNFFPCVGPEQKSAEHYFREAMHLCSLTDELGYTHIRQVEHYFQPYGGYSPNPLIFLTAAAMRTRNTRLITGAVLPAFNKPLKLAGEIGMLDGISDGRLEVGFARAFLPHEFTQFGVSLDESRRRFTEGLAQITHAAEGREGLVEGRVQQLQQRDFAAAADAEAAPAVLDRRDQHAGDLRLRRHQRLQGDGDPARPAKMRDLIGTYREAWKKAGHPGNGQVMNTFFMFCAPTRDEAMANGLAPCNFHLKGLADAAKEWVTGGASTKDYPGYDKLIAHVSSDTAERQVATGSAFIGSPADIVEMIRTYNDNVGGIDSVSLHFTPGNMPVETAESSLRLFSKEVLPKVTGL